MRKKILLQLLVFVLVLSSCSSTGDANVNEGSQETAIVGEETETKTVAEITDGTYTGAAPSYNGETEAEIVVENQEVVKINLVNTDDTESITSRAFPIIEERILEAQTPNVDSISSATISSNAYARAIGNAMEEAGFDITKEYTPPEVEVEDVETQLVIVGSGPSGMTAAVEAREQGVEDVILIEKEDILGGNGKFDEFFFNFPNTQAQRDGGIEDSKEDYAESVKGFDSQEFLDMRIDEVWEFDAWLRDHNIESNYVENQRDTARSSSEIIGPYASDRLEELAYDLDVDIRPSTKMVDLVMEDNVVKGVVAEHQGKEYIIYADRVLIATGGFSSNSELVSKYIPEADGLISSNTIGQTGDIISIAEEYSFKLDHMGERTLFNRVIPGTRYQLEAKTPGSLIVNKDGERYHNEEDTYTADFVEATLAQEGGVGYYIYDHEKLNERDDGMGVGEYNKSKSLEELAEKLDINYDNLIDSIEHLNAVSQGEVEDPLGNNDIGENVISLDSEYYYGTPIQPSIHMTFGGLVVDTQMHVLNNDDEVVENLFASGEVTATRGIYLEALALGRKAGEEIALSFQ